MLKSLLSMVAATVLLVGTASADTVRIALIDPLTGPMAAAGQSALDHLKFHAEKINANGGINGDKLEIVGLDNKVNPQESLVQLQKAIDDGIRYVLRRNPVRADELAASRRDKKHSVQNCSMSETFIWPSTHGPRPRLRCASCTRRSTSSSWPNGWRRRHRGGRSSLQKMLPRWPKFPSWTAATS